MSRIETIGNATLYLGDCREILPTLGKVDAVVTDPPYGIGWNYASHQDTPADWRELFSDVLRWAKTNARKSVFAVGSSVERESYIFANLDPKWRICWHKGSQGARCPIGFSDWEPLFIWGEGFGNAEKMHDYFSTAGMWPKPGEIDHPCPKPVEWGAWLIERMSQPNDSILDPFAGSGTTGVAAINLGRRFVGIEIEPRYFDVACRRLEAATGINPGPLFADTRAGDAIAAKQSFINGVFYGTD